MVIEIAKHINQVQALCEKHKVKELSAIENSRLDQDQVHFLVRFNADIPTMHYADNYCQLQDGFNSLFGKTVTLWFEKSFPDLNQLEEVKKSKRLLFEV
ncbi:MAG: hypothetical protein ABJH98_19560 [Reichenbachiella sp.]|uniref:hypothetical protein n=1 Tax=Reichenbachiella sp. TaxID=2184521 RepID=UPI00329898C4